MSTPTAAVVVCTRDRADRLDALLRHLEAQTVTDPWELVVVDDGSRDRTPAVLTDATARGVLALRVLRHGASVGPSVARDEGWRATTAPLVCFTDDDCEPHPGWLAELLAAHRTFPDALLQGRTDPIAREAHLLGPTSRTQRVRHCGPYFQTCNIAYPRAVLERVDGFDRSFGWGGEDCDLAWRAIEAGTPVHWVPEARVEHAVVVLDPVAFLRGSQRFSDSMRLYKRHPRLRRAALLRSLFFKPSHQLLLQAIAAYLLARRHPAWLVLAYPYVRELDMRTPASPKHIPLLVAHDALEIAATIRGAARHRTWVI